MRALVDNVPIGLLVVLAVGLILGAALFGLLLAFVVVIQYQNFGDAQSSVSQEANALAAIVRDDDALPQPGADRLRQAVGDYIGAVVVDEWPRMRSGKDSDRAWAAVSEIYRELQAIQPRPGREAAFYDDAVRQLTEALGARRTRLDAAKTELPPIIAALLIVGSVVILGYAALVGSRSPWFHAIGAGAIAIIIGFSLVVLLDLSYPFAGTFSITPEPFHTGILAQFGP
jgi:hypothetical protein